MIIGTARKDFLPRFGVSRREIVTISQFLDLFGCEFAEEAARQIAQQRIPQAVDAFEMLKEKNEPLEVGGLEFAVNAVERVGSGMRDLLPMQISLKVENVFARRRNDAMLLFGQPPGEEVYLTDILRKICRNLFTYKDITMFVDLQTTIDRVVIGDGDEVHPACFEIPTEFVRLGVAVREIKPPKEPFLRSRAAT
jgi:hypothetical protein